MRLPPKAGLKALLAGLFFVVAVQTLFSSCETNVVFHTKQVKWDKLYVVSAVPMIKSGMKEDGSTDYKPFCRSITDDAEGLTFKVLFKGSIKKGTPDRDQSIKPGDFVDNTEIEEEKVTSGLFEFNLKCLEPYPDHDLFACSGEGAMSGGKMEEWTADFHRYHQADASNDSNVAVAVLIDMSGSMIGLVDPLDLKEDHPDAISMKLTDAGFSKNGTDPGGFRYAAVESLIDTLNASDPLIVAGFRENSVKVICYLPGDPEAEKEKLLKECFGTNRDLVTGPMDPSEPNSSSKLDSFKGEEKGRSSLWTAVEEFYQYMKTAPPAQKAGLRHILVITDGPDTCSTSPDLNTSSGECLQTNTSYETVRDMIEEQEWEDRIPIHFVQMEAKGYKDRDPRQMEIACLTGGHFTFFNTADIPHENLGEVLKSILRRIRFTFRGHWRFNVVLGSVKKGNPPEVGHVYGLSGTGKVLPGEEGMLVKQEDVYTFSSGTEAGGSNADGRVAFRKECDPANYNCPEDEKAGECATRTFWCDEETLVCRSTEEWVENGTEGGCKSDDAKIWVTVETKVGESTTTENKDVTLKSIPTVCCKGICTPPRPPEVPQEITHPGSMVQACFWYEGEWGKNEEGQWVQNAKLKNKSGCPTWNELEDHLQYENKGDLQYPGDWDCTGDNCYPPPGAGGDAEPEEEEEEEGE